VRAALLDDAFTGNFFSTIDNLPLIHTAHTLINSGLTVANRPAADVALSVAGISRSVRPLVGDEGREW
jgi:hypothetical protein